MSPCNICERQQLVTTRTGNYFCYNNDSVAAQKILMFADFTIMAVSAACDGDKWLCSSKETKAWGKYDKEST